MKLRLTVAFVLYACAAGADSGDYYLYAPQPVTSGDAVVSGPEGVLVEEITIRKGDTLSAISRAFSGRASYYPQILLFNQISDPDLIYAGKTLRVPVAAAAMKPRGQKARRVPQVPAQKETPLIEPRQPVERKQLPVAEPPAPVIETREAQGEQELYRKAVKAYRGETCEDALPLLDTFLKNYPESLLAPDVALLRADCHLKLSGQH